MKVFVVVSKMKSNHTKVIAAFNSSNLAEVYRLHKEREQGSDYLSFRVLEVPLLDETPEMNRMVLEGFPERTDP